MDNQTSAIRKTAEAVEEEEKEEGQHHCSPLCQYAHKIKCVCSCGGKNHGIKSMIKMDAFFAAPEEHVVATAVQLTTPIAAAVASATIRCDDCRKMVSTEEVKVWLAPVAVGGSYESEQDPVYMCKRCTKIFLDDNKECHFEDLLYSVKDTARKYIPEVLEKWK